MLEIEKRWTPTANEVRDLRPGYTVQVFQRILEGKKERIQMFEGLIINVTARSGVNQTIRVRRIASGVGVERVFPVASPRIEKIVVVRKAKVRRANLRYMRALTGRGARLKDELVGAGASARRAEAARMNAKDAAASKDEAAAA